MNICLLAAVSILALSLSSCVDPKEVTYVQELTLDEKVPLDKDYRITLKKDDRLMITVISKNPELTHLFNKDSQSGSVSGTRDEERGYYINSDGNIVFPVLGRIKAAGKTCTELANYIEEEIIKRGYIKDPAVHVQLMNFKFSVLGEVKSPGSYQITGERLSLFDALSRAGDLSIDGNRDILIVREENGNRVSSKVDLRDPNLFSSPYYYIQQNDVIYVSPSDRKTNTRSEEFQIYPYLMSGTSLILVILALTL